MSGVSAAPVLDRPTIVDPVTSDDQPREAHIVGRTSKKDADAIVTEGYVLGQPLTALCGYTWVPSRDPERFPLCPRCRDLAKL